MRRERTLNLRCLDDFSRRYATGLAPNQKAIMNRGYW
jgi:hypothetical protein